MRFFLESRTTLYSQIESFISLSHGFLLGASIPSTINISISNKRENVVGEEKNFFSLLMFVFILCGIIFKRETISVLDGNNVFSGFLVFIKQSLH